HANFSFLCRNLNVLDKKGKNKIPGNQEERQRPVFFDHNLQIIFSITLMAVLGVASITPAFPNIGDQFGISPARVGLLITVFTLPGIILTPIMGILADRFGRKRILVPSLFLFAIAGCGCAFFNNFQIILVLRFFQGVGAASLGSLNAALIGDLYNGHRRGEAMGYNSSVLSVGTASYPAIGGALALIGWNFPFLLPVLAIPVGIVVLTRLKNPEPKVNQHFNAYISNAFKKILKKEILAIFLISIFTFIIIYGSFLNFFPFLMKEKFGSSSFGIGITMAVVSISSAVSSSRLGVLNKHFSRKQLLLTSYLAYILALILIPFMDQLIFLILPIVILGLANGLNIPILYTLLAEYAPLEFRGIFMSLNGMVLRIGQTLGPIVIGFFFNKIGLSAVFFSGAACAFLMLFIALGLIKKNNKEREKMDS
ncbi:MAG: MFS transporter, partial [Bacteroidota bacterium]